MHRLEHFLPKRKFSCFIAEHALVEAVLHDSSNCGSHSEDFGTAFINVFKIQNFHFIN